MTFKAFKLGPALEAAIEDQQYSHPTPIQIKAIPPILEGKDFLGCAQTGTGKTAAFAIPILQKLSEIKKNPEQVHPPRALVLAPTRELAIQIGESFVKYGHHLALQTGVVFGGVTPKRHIKVMKREPDILIATPGRLIDLLGQGHVDLSQITMFVLDEADRMLDLGMIKDVRHIIAHLPKTRQNLMFSATMPKEVMTLVHSLLKNPVKVVVDDKPANKLKIQQQVYFVDETDKTALLIHLLKDQSFDSVLVFARTKKKADKLAKAINVENIRTKAIHGDKNQSERQKALALFKNKEIRVLVATDVAARGIDIDRLSHVVNMDIPNVPETYVHRIGRTGRAGLPGSAVSFCSNQERALLKAVEQCQKQPLEIVKGHPYPLLNVLIEENRAKHGEQVKPGKVVGNGSVKKNSRHKSTKRSGTSGGAAKKPTIRSLKKRP